MADADVRLGQKRTLRQSNVSAVPPKADIAKHRWNVRFVPLGDIEPLAFGFRTAAI
jgi:hypothetical protein